MMNTDLFADASKASSKNFIGLTGQAFKGMEQLAALNLQVIKTLVADSAASGKVLLAAKSPQEFMKLQSAALQGAPEKAVAYGRQVKEIITAAGAGQRAAFEAQVAEVQSKFLGAVDGALKNAPGSEKTLALVKSAVAAANNAYEGVNKASKQVADAVDAKVKKVSGTAVTSSRNAARSTVAA